MCRVMVTAVIIHVNPFYLSSISLIQGIKSAIIMTDTVNSIEDLYLFIFIEEGETITSFSASGSIR